MHKYSVGEKLGSGSFGAVYEAIHNETGQEVAIKLINNIGRSEYDLVKVIRELSILKELRNQHCIFVPKFYEAFISVSQDQDQ